MLRWLMAGAMGPCSAVGEAANRLPSTSPARLTGRSAELSTLGATTGAVGCGSAAGFCGARRSGADCTPGRMGPRVAREPSGTGSYVDRASCSVARICGMREISKEGGTKRRSRYSPRCRVQSDRRASYDPPRPSPLRARHARDPSRPSYCEAHRVRNHHKRECS